MEEADDIATSVQSIFELVQVEFAQAAATMDPGKWTGLDADARARLTKHCREEVNKLRDVFLRVQATIDAVPGCDRTASEIDEEAAELEALRAREAATNALLRSLIAEAKEQAAAAAAMRQQAAGSAAAASSAAGSER